MTDTKDAAAITLLPTQKALSEFEKVSAGITALTRQYANVVYPVATSKGMDDAKAARLTIREPRYAVQRAAKAAKDELNSIKANVAERADQICQALMLIEEPIDAQIKAEELRRDEERKRKEAEEVARVAALRQRLQAIINLPAEQVGKSASDIGAALAGLSAVAIDDSWAEFVPHAADAKEKAVAALISLQQRAQATEEQAAELARQQAELARQQAELAQQKAELLAAQTAAAAARLAEQQLAQAALARQQAADAERAAFEAAPVEQADAFADLLPVPTPTAPTEPQVEDDWVPAVSQPFVPTLVVAKAPDQFSIDIADQPVNGPTDLDIVRVVADHFDLSLEQALDLIVNINVGAVVQAIAEAA